MTTATVAATDASARLGLALEGGGAKGAYHMGVVKAYREAGYSFDAVVGTSIGAINGAIIAQGNFEDGCRLWEQLTPRSIFDISDEEYRLLQQRKFDKQALRHLAARTRQIIASRGVDTRKMRSLIESIVRERELRDSATDFGLVTVSLSDRAPLELYKDDIPSGKLVDYLMASASFPGFQTTVIDNKAYIDGGLYDNCPINMLARKGYKRVIAVRTLGLGITRRIQYPDIAVTQIIPSESLGGMMNFSPDFIRRSLTMGYYDALRQLRGLQGSRYYIDAGSVTEDECDSLLAAIGEESVLRLGRMLGIGGMPYRSLWAGSIRPKLNARLRLPAGDSSLTFIVRLAELLAEAKQLDKYTVYSFHDFIRAARTGPLKSGAGLSFGKVEMCMAAQRILDGLRLPD